MNDPLMRAEVALRWVLCGVLAAACVFFFFHAARAITFPFPFDYGEGPLLEQARLLSRGENIYRARFDDYPFLIANYPPIFPSILSAIQLLVGPSYAAARVVTTAATLACAFFVSRIVRAFATDALSPRVA